MIGITKTLHFPVGLLVILRYRMTTATQNRKTHQNVLSSLVQNPTDSDKIW